MENDALPASTLRDLMGATRGAQILRRGHILQSFVGNAAALRNGSDAVP
jgi:hypothetical protein